jgi:signal transduction histidine kinase
MNLKKYHRSIYFVFSLLIFSVVISGCEVTCDCANNTDQSLYWNKKTAVAVVHSYSIMLGEMLKSIADTTEKKIFVRQAIDSVRFYEDSTGYFYVYNYNCMNIAHGTQRILQDSNLYNYKDSRGAYVIRLLSEKAKTGGGFVEFYWRKPGKDSSIEVQKLGYVEPIPYSDYFIGTGVYLQ